MWVIIIGRKILYLVLTIKAFKMKKILMTLAVAFVAIAANAQVYVGGGVGIGSSKEGSHDAVTTYKVLPEIGYNVNKDVAIGTVIGWGKGAPTEIEQDNLRNYITVQPYVRYTFAHTKYVNAFVDGSLGYTHYHGKTNAWSAGLKPGIAVNLNKKVSFVAHVGFAGWQSVKVKGLPKDSHAWGANLDGNHITFGAYYNF